MSDSLAGLLTLLAPLAPGVEVGPDTPLLSSGIIGSFDLARLLTGLEARFGVALDPADIGVDNFDTPRQMDALLRGAR